MTGKGQIAVEEGRFLGVLEWYSQSIVKYFQSILEVGIEDGIVLYVFRSGWVLTSIR